MRAYLDSLSMDGAEVAVESVSTAEWLRSWRSWMLSVMCCWTRNANYKNGPDDRCYHLVLFSTFEELKLPISGPMERVG